MHFDIIKSKREEIRRSEIHLKKFDCGLRRDLLRNTSLLSPLLDSLHEPFRRRFHIPFWTLSMHSKRQSI